MSMTGATMVVPTVAVSLLSGGSWQVEMDGMEETIPDVTADAVYVATASAWDDDDLEVAVEVD
jgi:hypothetical protein